MKILFLHKQNATFIKNDLKILRKHYVVTDFQFSLSKIPQLVKEIKKCDLVFVWFVSYPAFLATQIARVYKRPVILVAGGFGVAEYTLKKHKIFKLLVKSTIKNASEVLAVSKFTKREVQKLNVDYQYGVPVKVVYNGVNLTKFKDCKLRDNKKLIALTVGHINSWARYRLKGIDRFLDVARESPGVEFYVIGITNDIGNKVKNVPSNCHFFAPIPHKDLIFFYNIADVYCQFSRYESFCLTLLEAISCGCAPIISQGTAMSEIFNARNNIKIFDIKNREKKLVEVLDEYE